MTPLLPRPLAAGAAAAGAPGATVAAASPAARSLGLRLVAFAALALFGAAHWGTLVVGSAGWRTIVVVAVGSAGAAALAVLGRIAAAAPEAGILAGRRGQRLIQLAALGVALVTFLAMLVAAGLQARLLEPANWGELFDGLDRGLAGAQLVDWPYTGADEWISLSILLGAPVLVTLAALLAFWPARRGAGPLRAAALAVLLLLYGLPATEYEPNAPLLRGLVLLVLVAAWLWLPRLDRRDIGIAAAVVAGVGILALPAAAALDAERPWWDYGGLSWFGDGKRVAFDWTHQYGPLDWPRDGTTLLNVKSDRPHYWKAESLDVFDGFRWGRSSGQDGASVGAELPLRPPDGNDRWDYFERNPGWDARARFSVRSLSTDLVIGLGTTYMVDGVERAQSSGDGTMRAAEPLEKGDSYEVAAYAPDPSAAQMRGSPRGYPGALATSTQIYLPRAGENALEGNGRQGDAGRSAESVGRPVVSVPLRDSGYDDGGRSDRRLRASPYVRVYELALSLTASQPTSYDAVKAVENHLQQSYVYSERPPSQEYPLAAFLFEDRIGYCQQFSGAMALMLRMSGIPARVAAGFSPGSYNKDNGEYRVRDLDAHSWVEVYFTGVGWVPFDPTPSAAPAESQSTGAAATSAARADGGDVRLRAGKDGAASERGTDTGAAPLVDDGGPGWLWPALLVLALMLAMAGLLVARDLRARRALGRRELADAQLAELRGALERLGWEVPAQTTLLELERRLDRIAGPASARYAAGLRAYRYDPAGPDAPGRSERRAVRRELSAHGGLRGRLRALVALPPGGPRPA